MQSSTSESRVLPSFERPPLDEVAAGVQFAQLPLRLVDIGAFHAVLKDEYPGASDAAPLPPVFETFGAFHLPFHMPQVSVGLWRSWFLSAEEDYVIQIQPDRLLTNWRSRPGQPTYPRYGEVRKRFVEAFIKLEEFCQGLGFPSIQPNQCELGYFNKIFLDSSLKFGELGVVIRGLDFQTNSLDFTDAQFRASKILVDDEGTQVARLVVDCLPSLDDRGRQFWVLNINVRGRPKSPSLNGTLDVLDRAHIEIVNCFDNITTQTMHDWWGKI